MRNQERDGGPNFGDPRGDLPELDELAQTDLLLNALAARTESEFGDYDDLDDPVLTELLGNWRDDLRWPPASGLVSQQEAEDALRDGMSGRRQARRGLAAVGSVAATLLMLSGFGAVVADARPGDLLYGLHAMMFNEPRVSDDQIMLSAKADLAKVEQMIAQGQWEQAESQLAEVSTTLQAVNDGNRRQGLMDEVSQLNTKVEKHDPKATRPAAPPTQEISLPSAVPSAPVNSWTPLAPGAEAPPPTAMEPPAASQAPEPAELTNPEASATPTPMTPPPGAATPNTTPQSPSTSPRTSSTPTTTPSPGTTTTKPKSSSTTPSTSRPPTTTPTPSSAPTSKSKPPKPSTSATPGATPKSPAAGPSSPAPSTPSGSLWDRTSGPARPTAPRTPVAPGSTP